MESLPTGEIPRTFRLCAERYLCDKLIPGNRVQITGVYAVRESDFLTKTSSLRKEKTPYIYILGYENLTGGGRDLTDFYTDRDIAMFEKMAKSDNIY